jgi:hypothetical protein
MLCFTTIIHLSLFLCLLLAIVIFKPQTVLNFTLNPFLNPFIQPGIKPDRWQIHSVLFKKLLIRQKLIVIVQYHIQNVIKAELYTVLLVNCCDKKLVLDQFLKFEKFLERFGFEFLEH